MKKLWAINQAWSDWTFVKTGHRNCLFLLKRRLILALVSVNILSHVQTDYYFPAFIYGVDVSWR